MQIRVSFLSHHSSLPTILLLLALGDSQSVGSSEVPQAPPATTSRAAPSKALARIEKRVRATLSDPKASVEARYGAVYRVFDLRLRDLAPALERMAQEDDSSQVRDAAKHVLSLWKEQDDQAANERARSEEYQRRAAARAAMTPEERRQADREAERAPIRKFVNEHRQEILDQLNGTVEQRRAVVKSGAYWVEYLPEALPVLREMTLKETDPETRMKTAGALGHFDGPDGAPALRSCIDPKCPPRLRAIAARGLVQLGEKDGIPVLIELLRVQDDPSFGSFVYLFLQEATGQKIPYPFISPFQPRALTTQDVQDRLKAADAWETWWKKEGPTFVVKPRKSGTTSQPTDGGR